MWLRHVRQISFSIFVREHTHALAYIIPYTRLDISTHTRRPISLETDFKFQMNEKYVVYVVVVDIDVVVVVAIVASYYANITNVC